MNLIDVYKRFPTQQDCIAHLENIRWPLIALCPMCNSERVARKKEKERVGRWNCHECNISFNVLWERGPGFVEQLLQDDPEAIVAALNEALRQGARPVQLAEALAQAAVLRIARFHVQNEFADWIAVLHAFSYANALHQMLKRVESNEMLRGVYHGAMRVYLDRFLNIPPARLPSASAKTADHGRPERLLSEFLDLLNSQQQVDAAGGLVYRYLLEGGEPGPLFRTLAESLVREDAEFHSFQMLEAAIRQYFECEDAEKQRVLMVATARYLAAKAPTQRELLQTLRIAQRLHRGEPVYEEESHQQDG